MRQIFALSLLLSMLGLVANRLAGVAVSHSLSLSILAFILHLRIISHNCHGKQNDCMTWFGLELRLDIDYGLVEEGWDYSFEATSDYDLFIKIQPLFRSHQWH